MPAESAAEPWQPVASQFALRVLALAWSAGSYLAEVEGAEQDSKQLQRLYRTDHALTRIRRAAENVQVLAGVRIDDPGRQTTTVLDVIRAAASAAEQYQRIHIGHVADLAVTELAADDVIRILTELVDNAVRFSAPEGPHVTVSAHLTNSGDLMVRVEDSGIGVDPMQLPRLNAMLDGVTGVALDDQQAVRLGLLVVSCLTRAHRSLRVQLSPRRPVGTVAMLVIGADLLCEIPQLAVLAPPARRQHRTQPALRPASPPRLRAVPPSDAPPRRPGPPPGESRRPAEVAATAVLPVVAGGGGGAMPRRVPGSVRGAGGRGTAAPKVSTQPRSWQHDLAEFDAGLGDARQT